MKINKYVIIISILSFILSFGFVYIKIYNIIWSDTINISAGIEGSGLIQSMSVQKDNNVSFAWKQSIGDPKLKIFEIYYCEYKDGIVTQAQNISNTPTQSLNPVIICDKEGTIHAVWEERDSTTQDLYYTYKKNGIWNKPVSIFHYDSSINVDYGIKINLKIDKKNDLYIIWKHFDRFSPKSYIGIIKYYQITNKARFPFDLVYNDFQIDENNIIHLTRIAPYIGGQNDINSVLYTYSADSGKTWANQTLVNKSGQFPAYGIRILKDGNSVLHIIWGKDRKGQQAADCIYHSMSTDGITWSEPIVIGGNIGGYILYDPQVAMDSKNHIHLFYTWTAKFIELPFQLNYSFYDGNNWTEPFSIKYNGSNPEIGIDNNDILHMIYYEQQKSFSPDTKIVTWFYMQSVNPVTKIKIEDITPVKYILNQNYPNPFNPSTVLSFELRVKGYVILKVYDVLGREIRTLVNEHKEAGKHNISFDAEGLAGGTYFYRLIVQPSDGSRTITLSRSMQVIK